MSKDQKIEDSEVELKDNYEKCVTNIRKILNEDPHCS